MMSAVHLNAHVLTRAPPSSVHSRVMGSMWTPAVRPTAEAPYRDQMKIGEENECVKTETNANATN